MRALAIVASLVLVACQSTAVTGRPVHSDLTRAIVAWENAKLETYSFTIEYRAKGCRIATARVEVKHGRVKGASEILSYDPCAADRQRSLSGVIDRSFSDLLAELVLFEAGVLPIDLGRLPIEMSFDQELGFPRTFRLHAAIDQEIFEIPVGSDVPSDYEYIVLAFRAGPTGLPRAPAANN